MMIKPTYTSRLIKASALLADTKTLLATWDVGQSVAHNIERAKSENILGKASRTRAERILGIFRQRFFDDPSVGEALVHLAQANVSSELVDPLLYYYSVQNDDTLRAIIREVVYPRRMSGFLDINTEQIVRSIRDWVSEGRTTSEWGEDTIQRVARNSMAALRDFGVLQGKNVKSITPIYLPIEAFAFLALEMTRHTQSGDAVLNNENWKLFFLPIEGVERFFLEAHQEKLLSYHAAGSVIRLDFPVDSLVEYAYVLIERTR